jgi:uncharacterized protein
MTKNLLFKIIFILLGGWIIFDIFAHFMGEILWFQEVNYLGVFSKRLITELGLGVIGGGISLAFLLGNLYLSQKLKWEKNAYSNIQKKYYFQQDLTLNIEPPQTPSFSLKFLLPLIIFLSLVMGLRIIHYTKVAREIWRYDFNLPTVISSLPQPFKLASASVILGQIFNHIWVILLVIFIIGFLLIKTKLILKTLAFFLSILLGFILAGNWTRVLQYFNPSVFNQQDPLFHINLDFYVFTLPNLQLFSFWLEGLLFHGLIAATLIYLLSGNSLSEGKFPGFSCSQLRHLYLLTSALMIALSFRHWLTRYELLYSQRGVTYGASYTDVFVQLPMETILSIGAFLIGIWLFYQSVFRLRYHCEFINLNDPNHTHPKEVFFIGIYLGLIILTFFLYLLVQRLNVQPNELARETPYLQRSIEFTRAGFGLDKIEAQTFNPEGKLTQEDIKNNHLTIDNIRLWDTRPILKTNRQLQQLRLYYSFLDADIDRYSFNTETLENNQIIRLNNVQKQVIISPRELDYSAVPDQAKTWVNEHLVYTHGYGFTLCPVHYVDEGGLPFYFIKNIGGETEIGNSPKLTNTNILIKETIPLDNPRIYYGELTNTYILTPSTVEEFDFPRGEENVKNTYSGLGGIPLGSIDKRLIFAEYFKDVRMLFAENLTNETKLLFRRNINERIRAIAPFLRYDKNPYLVVADTGSPQKNNLYWIVDAYTTSDHYPYSDPGENNFNYIRNSVKVLIDAYNGNVSFYIADREDPILQSWGKIFPNLFQPLEKMPISLKSHIRYPEDIFNIQAERLLTYHMSDPQVFYNREDQWQIPREIYGGKTQSISPYYLIMKFPNEEKEEFILLNPYTPTSRPNLIAWLAGRSDGENYGKLLLYQFPKQKLVYGPNQIEALINQDPVISQQISLWTTKGSNVIQGNLLVIPIEQSLLYVEPLYLEAENNSLPTLIRVIVVYENRIVMAETMEKALDAIFDPQPNNNPPIIRPVDELLNPPVIEN